jgi:hypothetical protein
LLSEAYWRWLGKPLSYFYKFPIHPFVVFAFGDPKRPSRKPAAY